MKTIHLAVFSAVLLCGCATLANNSKNETWISLDSGLTVRPDGHLGQDTAGNTYAAWCHKTADSDYKILARKLSPAGAMLWESPVEIYSSTCPLNYVVVAQAADSMYVLWREQSGKGWLWLAGRIGSDGEKLWSLPVELDTAYSGDFVIDAYALSDGALAAAFNDKNPANNSVFMTAVKIRPDGTLQWRIELGKDTPNAWYQLPVITPDETGGFYLAYRLVDSSDRGIMLDHLDPLGNRLWPQGLV